MSGSFELLHPWVLLLSPLALLPLLRGKRDALRFAYLPWLPRDRIGRVMGFLWSFFAVGAILSIVVALAGPGRPQTEITRTGRGAEVLLLIDRSRSMDDRMLPTGWEKIDPLVRTQQAWHRGPQKSQTARELLSRFVDQRPMDRFALMFFSAGPLPVVPFTQHAQVVQAGISAGGIGRGLSDTNVGRALIAAIHEFDRRVYSGSRIILLVSDGGAKLDASTRVQIREGLRRNRIALYWLYLRSINSPKLGVNDARSAIAPEAALHRFFETLETPYHAYQAEEPKDLEAAVNEVARQQNLPLDYVEQIPREDYSRYFLALAALACVALLVLRSLQLRGWE
jgi:mxaC protein